MTQILFLIKIKLNKLRKINAILTHAFTHKLVHTYWLLKAQLQQYKFGIGKTALLHLEGNLTDVLFLFPLVTKKVFLQWMALTMILTIRNTHHVTGIISHQPGEEKVRNIYILTMLCMLITLNYNSVRGTHTEGIQRPDIILSMSSCRWLFFPNTFSD